MDVCGGVVGVGLERSGVFSCWRSVRIGGGSGGGASATVCTFRPDMLALLPLLRFPNKLRPLLPPFDFTDARSEPLLLLLSFFSWLGVNASRRRRPGETLCFFPLLCPGISNIEPDCVVDLDISASGLDSEASALGPLTADSKSVDASGAPASADAECIKGEDEV